MPEPTRIVSVSRTYIEIAEALMNDERFVDDVIANPQSSDAYSDGMNHAREAADPNIARIVGALFSLGRDINIDGFESARRKLGRLASGGAIEPTCESIELTYKEAYAINNILNLARTAAQEGGINYLEQALTEDQRSSLIPSGETAYEVLANANKDLEDLLRGKSSKGGSSAPTAAEVTRSARGFAPSAGAARAMASVGKASRPAADTVVERMKAVDAKFGSRVAGIAKGAANGVVLENMLKFQLAKNSALHGMGEMVIVVYEPKASGNSDLPFHQIMMPPMLEDTLTARARKDGLPTPTHESIMRSYEVELQGGKKVWVGVASLSTDPLQRTLETIDAKSLFADMERKLAGGDLSGEARTKLEMAKASLEPLKSRWLKGELTPSDFSGEQLHAIVESADLLGSIYGAVGEALSPNPWQTPAKLAASVLDIARAHYRRGDSFGLVDIKNAYTTLKQVTDIAAGASITHFVDEFERAAYGPAVKKLIKKHNEPGDWRSFAEALVKAHPDRFRSVDYVLDAVGRNSNNIRQVFQVIGNITEYDRARSQAISEGTLTRAKAGERGKEKAKDPKGSRRK